MIRYSLQCCQGHVFESWFQSASAFDSLTLAGHVTCSVCGETDVSKALMAPTVCHASESVETKTQDKQAEAIAKMRQEVENNATYVGGEFAKKARDMHEGLSSETSIYGEANLADARALIEDGIPVMPLPFKPKQKLQ